MHTTMMNAFGSFHVPQLDAVEKVLAAGSAITVTGAAIVWVALDLLAR